MPKSRNRCRHHGRAENQNSAVVTAEPDSYLANDIDEQLRLQRRKKILLKTNPDSQQVSPSDDNKSSSGTPIGVSSNTPETKKQLGNYMYDPSRGAYFPTKFVKGLIREESERSPFNNSLPDTNTRRPSSFVHTVQLLHGSIRRRRLVGHWSGKMILDSMSIRPVYDGDLDLLNFRVTGEAEDLRCAGMAPWTQCFGVFPSSQHDQTSPPKMFSLSSQIFNHGKILAGTHENCESSVTTSTLGCLKTFERKTMFVRLGYGGDFLDSIELDDEVNDFTQVPHHPDGIILAGNRGHFYKLDVPSRNLSPGSLDFPVTERHRKRLVKSDILCVESDESCSRPHLVFFGQRNGRIIVHDLRTSKQAGFLMSQSSQCHTDSVLRIQPLFRQRPDQLLSRGRKSWSMYDLRGMGGTGDGTTALIRSVSFENSLHNPSVAGKGMAIDPLQSTIIVPLWQSTDAKSKAYKACLRLWSLESGCYLGSKFLSSVPNTSMNPNLDPGVDVVDSSSIELCSTLTRAWFFERTGSLTATSNRARILQGAFGLWLKLGQYDFYHMTCDGRLDLLNTPDLY
jgi:hypothetical protein